MDKLLPLIPGCKALMLATDFQHRLGDAPISLPVHEVTVVDRCPALDDIYACPRCAAKNFWFVHSPMLNLPPLSGLANCACQLIRIDGGDFEQETQRANKELWWESRLRQLEKNQAELDRLAKNDQFFWGLSTKQIQDQLRRKFG